MEFSGLKGVVISAKTGGVTFNANIRENLFQLDSGSNITFGYDADFNSVYDLKGRGDVRIICSTDSEGSVFYVKDSIITLTSNLIITNATSSVNGRVVNAKNLSTVNLNELSFTVK